MTVLLALIIVLGIFLGAAAWVFHGLPGLMRLTYHVADFCHGLFVKCAGYYDLAKVAFLWLGAAILLGGLVYGVIKGVAGIIKARSAVKKLPLSKKCGPVVLIKDDKSLAAFTHGLIRPSIYISTGLIKSLERDELKSVFLHELHHKRRLDPLRFFLFTLFNDTFFYIPAVGSIICQMRSKKECEADDAALAAVKNPLTLANALVKVVSFHRDLTAMPVSFTGGIRGGGAIDRVKRLVEGHEVRLRLPSFGAMLSSVLMAAFLAASFAVPLYAASPAAKECGTRHCAAHIHKNGKSGMECKVHCAASAHRH